MSADRERDVRDGLDAIQADMAEHQRAHRGEVSAEANRQLAVETFTELEARGAFEPPPPPIAPPAPTRQERRLLERQEREVNGKKYVVTKDDAVGGPTVPLSQRQRGEVVKALQRLHLLLSMRDEGILGAPSWSNRAKAVFAIIADPKSGTTMAEREIRFAMELDALLEDSNRLFGSWMADPEPKIFVGA